MIEVERDRERVVRDEKIKRERERLREERDDKKIRKMQEPDAKRTSLINVTA